jgi:hypothetical protein
MQSTCHSRRRLISVPILVHTTFSPFFTFSGAWKQFFSSYDFYRAYAVSPSGAAWQITPVLPGATTLRAWTFS